VKNRITRNVNLDRGETIQKEFKSLKAKDKFCSMMLTDKRLIIYTYGREIVKGRRVKRQIMNEIDLRSIHRFEYYYEFHNKSVFLRGFGLFLFVLGLVMAYTNYAGIIHNVWPQFDGYFPYIFGIAAILATIGLFIIFSTDKVLILQMKSGLEEKTTLLFFPTKENELALRFIAGRIHIH